MSPTLLRSFTAWFRKSISLPLLISRLCRDAFSRFNALSVYPMVPGIKEIYDQWHSVVLRVGHFLCISSGQEVSRFDRILLTFSSVQCLLQSALR